MILRVRVGETIRARSTFCERGVCRRVVTGRVVETHWTGRFALIEAHGSWVFLDGAKRVQRTRKR